MFKELDSAIEEMGNKIDSKRILNDAVFLLDFTEGLISKRWLNGYEPIKNQAIF